MIRRAVVFLLLFSSGMMLAQSTKRPLTFEDMMALRRVGDPVVSSDGKWTMFSAVDVSLEENTRKSHLWVVPVAGGEARSLTSGSGAEDRGRFSPDGKWVIFQSSREGGAQLWLQSFDPGDGKLTGEARRLTNLSTGADGAIWSPDGKNIVFVSAVYPDCPASDDGCNKSRDESLAKSKVKAKIFTRLMFRHWNRYADGKRSHLFVIPVDGTSPPRDLTPGDHDVPPFSLGGQDFYSISPDGKEVAYTVNLEPDEATSTNNDIYVVSLSGGAPRKISDSPGSDSNPLTSPDGRYIAYRMQEKNGFESDRFQLVTYDRSSGLRKNLTPNFDRWVGTMAWSPDSRHIYFNADDHGETPVYRVAVTGGEVKEVFRGHNDDLQLVSGGKEMVFTRQSIEWPNEIFKISLSEGGIAGKATALTKMNATVFARVHTSPGESFWFTGAEDAKVQGWLVKPPNFDAKKKYPVKFLVHGGPQSAWGDAWSFRWNAQLFAASGYVAVLINPRGSVGYGQKFTDEVTGDWGGRAYVDLMMGLDHVEANFPFIEKGNVCAMGASYGGYMVNWIITQTDRFKCAVSHDGTFNTQSQWGTTEELFFKEWEFRGTPWTNRELFRKFSPHLQAAKMKTPTLIIHGQLDYRIDVSEGFQFFTTLQRLRVPSKMLYFPDEGHWVLKPQNGQLWYKTVNDWVDSYLRK